MIIGLWLDRLLENIFLHAFQQLSIVPVWASTFGLPRWERHTIFENWPDVCATKYRRRTQRNIKYVQRSTEDDQNAGREERRPTTLITPPHPPTPRITPNAKNAKTLCRFSGRRPKLTLNSLNNYEA